MRVVNRRLIATYLPNSKSHDKDSHTIQHVCPGPLSEDIMIIEFLLRPIAIHLAKEYRLAGLDLLWTHWFASPFSGVRMSGQRLGCHFRQFFQAYGPPGSYVRELSISHFRQIHIAFGIRHLGADFRLRCPTDATNETTIFQMGSGHLRKTEGVWYARPMDPIPDNNHPRLTLPTRSSRNDGTKPSDTILSLNLPRLAQSTDPLFRSPMRKRRTNAILRFLEVPSKSLWALKSFGATNSNSLSTHCSNDEKISSSPHSQIQERL
jgi:hypothetical protein